jgi:hypothetical protein
MDWFVFQSIGATCRWLFSISKPQKPLSPFKLHLWIQGVGKTKLIKTSQVFDHSRKSSWKILRISSFNRTYFASIAKNWLNFAYKKIERQRLSSQTSAKKISSDKKPSAASRLVRQRRRRMIRSESTTF